MCENKTRVGKSGQGSGIPRLGWGGRMRPWFPGFPTRAACPRGALAPTCRARVAARPPVGVPRAVISPRGLPLWPAGGAHGRWTAEESTACRCRSPAWRNPRETSDQISLPAHRGDEGTGYADTSHVPRPTLHQAPPRLMPRPCTPLPRWHRPPPRNLGRKALSSGARWVRCLGVGITRRFGRRRTAWLGWPRDERLDGW